MRLFDHLSPHSVLTGLRLDSRDAVLKILVESACAAWSLPHPEQILDLVRAREAKMSTGIGHCLAVPHAKCDHVPDIRLACCTLPDGVDFHSPDRQPVRLAFLLLSPPSSAGSHVRALSAVSRISPDLLEELVASNTPLDFLACLERAESARS
ncbi:MAG: PTS sugar transporter subunit IIA [Fibrobacteria bacterium]|nr:PTS sugar transporter subunit IIA [Fibrobacteria bacterium]